MEVRLNDINLNTLFGGGFCTGQGIRLVPGQFGRRWLPDPAEIGLAVASAGTEKLRITERFRRLDLGRLEVETTYDDPSEFKKPFTMREVRLLAPKGEEVLEYVCVENERDVSHMHFEK